MQVLEAEIKALTAAIGALDKAIALANSKLDDVRGDISDTKSDSQKMWVEIRSAGNKMLDLSNAINAQGRELADIKPSVASLRTEVIGLQTDRAAVLAIGKTAAAASGPIGKLIYLIGAGLIAAGAGLVGYSLK